MNSSIASRRGPAWGLATAPSTAARRSLLALGACGLGTVIVYAAAFSLPYSIDGGLAKPLLDFAKISGPAPGSTVALIVSLGVLFALYLSSLKLCRRLEGNVPATALVAGFGCLSALALLPMYPVFSLDVFYYMAADRIWSVYRENPFLVPPLQGAHDPFFPYTRWGHYPLPYGPLWPWITAGAAYLGAGAIPSTLVAFKALAVVGYLACLPLVFWSAAAAVPMRRTTALCIFAWNPLVLIELAGNAHNDAIALVPAVFALGLWARGRTALAVLALTTSFLVKATALVLAPFLLWVSFVRALGYGGNPSTKTEGWRPDEGPVATGLGIAVRIAGWGVRHLGPGVALAVLAWLPFATASGSVGFLREFDQHYQSITAILLAPVPPAAQPAALRLLQGLLLLGYGAYGLSQLRYLAAGGPVAIQSAWRLMILYFVLLSPFYVGWYMLWPVLLSAMLVDRRITLLTTLLCMGSLATHLVQFVVVPLAGPSLGWAQTNSLAVLAAFAPFAAGCAAFAWQRGIRLPAPLPR